MSEEDIYDMNGPETSERDKQFYNKIVYECINNTIPNKKNTNDDWINKLKEDDKNIILLYAKGNKYAKYCLKRIYRDKIDLFNTYYKIYKL